MSTPSHGYLLCPNDTFSSCEDKFTRTHDEKKYICTDCGSKFNKSLIGSISSDVSSLPGYHTDGYMQLPKESCREPRHRRFTWRSGESSSRSQVRNHRTRAFNSSRPRVRNGRCFWNR